MTMESNQSKFVPNGECPERVNKRRAKIVCTLGPSSNTEELIRDLMRLGMDVARLNFSHGTHEDHSRVIARVRKMAEEEQRSICILQDLQGPKMRTGRLHDHKPVVLKPGSTVTLTTRDVLGNSSLISTSFEPLPREVHPGSRILLSDGRISLLVKKVRGQDIECEVIDGGSLGEHQGINLPGAVISVPSLTEKDYKDLKFGLKHGVDVVAVSFVRSANDVRVVKRAIAEQGYNTPVIAKLEKPQAIDNLEEILEVADGVMVARGDLGVEVPPEKVPIIQKHVIRRAQELRKPVITATQMLESMIQNPRPTRAEASDVANAIFDGSDAVMLSGETAAGKYPREAVSMMARIIMETEAHLLDGGPRHRREKRGLSISETICESVAHAAEELNIRAIAIYTESGTTARLISKYRPRAEVYAFTHIPEVRNRANLYWGVQPILAARAPDDEAMVRGAQAELLRRGVIAPKDVLAVAAGTQPRAGSTNFMQLHVVQTTPAEPGSSRRVRVPKKKT
ncbi:MAG TPA: pyruvate kinase [Clostridia bacterium]|nr:pyruvate kinase [Clostridia bacterium]